MAHSSKKPTVVIMYLLWDQEPMLYLPDAIAGVTAQSFPKEQTEFLIVYNSHKPENDSAFPYIESEIAKHRDSLPHTTLINNAENLGFSGGNNFGMQWAIDHGYDYVFLHNGDGYLGADCLSALVQTMEQDETVGAAQSLVLLHPDTDLINTSGNALHYLGFGYCDDYRRHKDVFAGKRDPLEVGYISGAAIMMRTDLLKAHGLWDQDYFMYHEDTDYTLRLRMLGYRSVMVPDSEFFHKYQFSKSIQKYYWMERNRIVILLLFYRWPTLLLLLPMELVLEVGLFLFAIKNGWWKERFRVYVYWLQPQHWVQWLKKRRPIQASRTISDRQLMQQMTGVIKYQEIDNPVLTYIGNPILKSYFWLLKLVVRW